MREKFKANFELPSDGFSSPIDIQDIEVGFSVLKIREQEGFKSLFRVFIPNEDLTRNTSLKRVTVTASYGKESEGGIVIASSEFKRGLNWPIELISEGEFYYNPESDSLIYKDEPIKGLDLLKKVDGWHTKPTRFITGFILRTKLGFWREWISVFPIIFIWMLYLVSGDKVTRNLWERVAERRRSTDQSSQKPEKKESTKLNLFGYMASQWALTVYSLLHLMIFLLVRRWDIHIPEIISEIFSNNFLTVLYVIITLGFIDDLLPKVLKYLIHESTNLVIWASSKKIKI